MAAQDAQTFNWNVHHGEFDDKNNRVHGGRALLAVSFSLFLMSTLLYIMWACCCRRPRRRHGSAADSSSGSSSSNATTHRAAGLDPEAIRSIPVHLHLASEGREDAQCSICLVGFEEGDKVKALPRCNHRFHPACVDVWLRTRSNCPLCRSSLGAANAAADLELVVH